MISAECPGNRACQNEKCIDPCPGSCGSFTTCTVINHAPMCYCQTGYTGDPFTGCSVALQSKTSLLTLFIYSNFIIFSFLFYVTKTYLSEKIFNKICFSVPPTEGPRMPCNPSPCGANAICKERNGAGSCSCLPEYFGDPYTGCRPECVINTDCDRSKACLNNKCRDPCPGTCGINAECRVINHAPSCTCRIGYSGDPLKACTVIQPGITRIFYLLPFCLNFTSSLKLVLKKHDLL